MKKTLYIISFLLSTLVEIACVMLYTFFGMLADEGVDINNFNTVYIFGIVYNYSFLYFLLVVCFLLAFVNQVLLIAVYLYRRNDKGLTS